MVEKIWIVVANASFARVFAAKALSFGEIEEIKDFAHPASRRHERDIYADKAGLAFDCHGEGRHAMEPGTHAKEHEADVFARELAAMLEDARLAGRFQHLAVIASSRMLGCLRQAFTPALDKLVTLTIPKDLTHEEPEQILAHLY